MCIRDSSMGDREDPARLVFTSKTCLLYTSGLKNNDYLTVDGNSVSSPLGAVEPDDPRGWLNLFYNTDNFTVEFCHQFRLCLLYTS